MSERPWMKFYPSDWRGSTSLKLVSMGARGLWIEMLCVMHEATPYGHMVHKGRVIEPAQLAAMVGASGQEVDGWLAELEQNGVFSRKRNGVIASSRMEKDEKRRRIGRETGARGGNPNLRKDKGKAPTLNGHGNGHANPSHVRVLDARGQSPESEKKEELTLSVIDGFAASPETDFEAWWKTYPRKVGKPSARRAYLRARKVAGAAELAEGVKRYSWSDEIKWIAHPATWLNDQRWKVEATAPAKRVGFV